MHKLKSVFMSTLLSATALTTGSVAIAQEGEDSGAQAAAATSDRIVVRGAYIPDEKRDTSEISSLLDEVEFVRQGDSDIAASLRRVTGLSLSEGKFVYVRGLNERYSNATLNGSPMPSPEPLRRVAPLDLFPTSVVSSVLVQKTFAPQFSGEFGGGLIEMRTKSLPDERFFEVSGSLGARTTTTLKDNGLLYSGGNRDFLGFDDGVRNFPGIVGNAFAENVTLNTSNFSSADLADTAVDIGSRATDLFVLQEGDVGPDWSFRVTGGDKWYFGDIGVGFVSSIGLSNDWQTLDREKNDPSVAGSGENITLVPSAESDIRSTEQTSGLNGLFSLGFELYNDHEITLTAIGLRKTSKEASIETGNDDSNSDFRIDRTEFTERQVWVTQANGSHLFPFLNDLSVDWRVSYSEALRDRPFTTAVPYVQTPFVLQGIFDQSEVFGPTNGFQGDIGVDFSLVKDQAFHTGFDAELPLILFGDKDVTLKAGYAYTDRERDATTRSLELVAEGFPSDVLSGSRIDVILLEPNVRNFFSLTEVGGIDNPAGYVGSLEVDGAYGGFDAQITNFLRAAVGVRYEDGVQQVATVPLTGTGLPTVACTAGSDQTTTIRDGCVRTIAEDYFLPAVTLTWNFADNMQTRVGFSQTISRPEFREIGAAPFLNTDTEETFAGNPFLENTELTNVDARWEWYFGRDQFVTLGAFYKDLENPIEEFTASTGDDLQTTFINAPSATLFGFEFEFEQYFEVPQFFVFDNDWFSRKDLVFKTNYTWTDSEVKVSEGDLVTLENGEVRDATVFIDADRRLQGQSDHIFNIQFGLEDTETDMKATLLLNWASERIRTVATQLTSEPDILEKPPVTLDFVLTRGFELYGGQYEFGFKMQNILNDHYEATQSVGGTSFNRDRYDLGRTISMSLKRSF